MKSILQEFAYGNISPEVRFFERNSKYGQAIKLVANLEERLLGKLGTDDKELFEKFVDAECELNQITATDNLVHGYKLGLTMTAEAFVGINDLYSYEEL